MRRLFISFLVLFVWAKTFSQTDSKEIQNKVDLFDKYIQSSMYLYGKQQVFQLQWLKMESDLKKGYGVTNIDKPQPFTTSTISFALLPPKQ
jgi:hypothetical protein